MDKDRVEGLGKKVTGAKLQAGRRADQMAGTARNAFGGVAGK